MGFEIVYMNEEQAPISTREQEFSWIRSVLNNDRSAFDKLVRRYQDKVFNLCFRMMGDYEEGRDCAQETFVRAYRALKDFRFEASFSTWILTIAVNICRNRLKSLEHRYRRSMLRIDSFLDGTEGSSSIEIEDPAPNALAQLTKKEQDQLLQKAIDELPHDAKIVTVLRDIEGLSYEEIVRITGYNPGTVKSKLARAREHLRQKLKGMF
jgi:RNA polymerase sigma-70 factor (ECF subfamily)